MTSSTSVAPSVKESSHCSRVALATSTGRKYEEKFSASPVFVSAAPGRVNLIGEHVDHQGYDVMPCAIEQTIRVAVGHGSSPSSLEIFFSNSNEHLPKTKFADLAVATKYPCASYVMAALFGIAEYFSSNRNLKQVGKTVARNGTMPSILIDWLNSKCPEGLRLYIEGEVPIAAGVSSSSALVVGSAMALLSIMNLEVQAEEAAAFTALAECHVGTASGGMDQASIILSQTGRALQISFNPVRGVPLDLPQSAVFVIANSCVQAPKAVQAATCYNKRVFELKTACAQIWMKKFGETRPVPGLRELTLKKVQLDLNLSLPELEELARTEIGTRAYTSEKCMAILTKAKLLDDCLAFVGPAVLARNTYFEPLRRVLHVISEVERVAAFANIAKDTTLSEGERLVSLGVLMNLSQESLALEFDASAPELDELCRLAREQNGCYGCRLTGAGWGGCVVALVHVDKVKEFCTAMRTGYFEKRNLPSDAPLFAVRPASGAACFRYVNGGAEPIILKN